MDSEQALPILRDVLARRDDCSAPLRRKAVFLVSQVVRGEAEDILLGVIRSDPDSDVRREAVFWMSQVPSERVVNILDSIVRNTDDEELQDKAIFSLSQHSSPRARQILFQIASRSDASVELRGRAIKALGFFAGGAESGRFLRDLYPSLRDDQLRQQLVESIAQIHGTETGDFLMRIIRDPREDVEVRKKAAYALGEIGPAAKEAVPALAQALAQVVDEVDAGAVDVGGLG
jgi:HEAT repeat protein